jgi:hypothetical protein
MNTIEEHLKRTKTDIFIILLDTFMLYPHLLSKDLSPAKVFFWFPSDGGAGMPKGCEQILKKVDVPVAMAKFGQKQVKDYYGIEVKHIPHGTESNKFYRLNDKDRTKLRKAWGLDDKFVVGVVARNQPRGSEDHSVTGRCGPRVCRDRHLHLQETLASRCRREPGGYWLRRRSHCREH